MKNDRISVGILISTYNWPKALESVLFSILQQSRLPDEILIADDGSTAETAELIRHYQQLFHIPLKHAWHEDNGFRKSTILNKAMKLASADYIIQIDGDIVLHKYFVEDHLAAAHPKRFIQGSRAILDKERTREVLENKKLDFKFYSAGLNNRFNALRIPFLSSLIKTNPDIARNIKSCNLAFWKKDYVAVNGYDNFFHGWGWEDDEFAARLINAGIQKHRLKLAAICYHLDHDHHSKIHSDKNEGIFNETVNTKRAITYNGLAQV